MLFQPRKIVPRFTMLALLGLLCGFTECSYYTTVEVPASDTSPPSTYQGVHDGKDYIQGAYGDDDLRFVTREWDRLFALVGSGNDAGGTKRLRVTYRFSGQCCASSGLCQKHLPRSTFVYEDAQDGTTGSRVSSGIWGYYGFTGKAAVERICDYPYNSSRSRVTVSWETEAWDFKDNKRTSGRASATYTR